MSSLKNKSCSPRTFPSTGFDRIYTSDIVEEEGSPLYKPEKFYPVRIGEVFNGQYQTVGKLGYGSISTVWLCRDLLRNEHVTLKVYMARSKANREVGIYNHLNSIQSDNAGAFCVRKLLDSFQVQGPDASHLCLVHPPLGISVNDFMRQLPGKVFNKTLLRPTIRRVLSALDYLHQDARVVHTDIQPNNILLGIGDGPKDKNVLINQEQAEMEEPILRKVTNDRCIYVSRRLPITLGKPVLCDFSEARFRDEEHKDDIMPTEYRAPEVILNMGWDHKVDIWSVAMVAWDLFERRRLFGATSSETKFNDAQHLAQMVAIMGPPPLEFLKRSETSLKYWDEDGNWKGLAPIPENRSLEYLEDRLEGEDKKGFLSFLRKVLCWVPEERGEALDLFRDIWILEDLLPQLEAEGKIAY